MEEVHSVGAPEGQPAYPVQPETATPSESPSENNQNDTTPVTPEDKSSSAASVPFHEDPKVQEYINRQVESRVTKGLEAYKPVLDKFKPEEKADIPYWFNGDEKQWKDFEGYIGTLSDKKAEEKIQALKATQDAETKRVTDATTWFTDSVTEIEKDGAKVDRNKLLKFVLDNELIDAQGRWNYKAGYKFMAAQEKAANDPTAPVELRKKIADDSRSDTRPEPKLSDVKSNTDFKRSRPW